MSDENPYENTGLANRKPGTVSVEENRAMAEVKAQVFMAREFPRDVIAATDRILMECDRYKLAEKAVYSFPRGNTTVSGPTIKLAEAIQRAWGNMMSGIIEVERTENESSMLAYAWDLETNSMKRQEFKVPHSRDTKNGKKALTDDRDIYEMTANQGARRLRSCILALIPGDVVDAAVARCEKTLVSKVGDLAVVIPKMVEKFAAIGVTKTMIEKRLHHRIETTQPAEVVQLGSVYNSIVEGFGSVEEYFEGEPKAPEDVIKTSTGKPKDKAPAPAPAEPAAAERDDGFALTSDPPVSMEDIVLDLEGYQQSDKTPAAAKKEIAAALANPSDLKALVALLEKTKAACR